MKKIFVGLIAIMAMGAATAFAVGAFPGAQSTPVEVTVPTDEPIRVQLVETSKEPTGKAGSGGYAVYPGEPLVLTYEISNWAPHGMDYVVELVPTIEGEWQQVPVWELELRGAGEANPQGPAHLALDGGGGKQRVNIVVTWPRSITINPLPSASVVLNAFRTDCTEVEGCPWG